MISLLELLSWLATFSTIGLYLTGLLDCKKIIDTDGTGSVPFLPFLTTHFCCGLWFGYGVMQADATVKFVNAAGLGLSAIYMVCYMSFSKRKSVQITLIVLCGAMAFGLEYYLTRIIRDRRTRIKYLSLACIVTTIVMQASPLFTVATVFRTRSTESMQFMFCLMMTIVSSIWLSYGYALGDSTIMAPNITGVALGLIQLSLFLLFPTKPIKKTKKTD